MKRFVEAAKSLVLFMTALVQRAKKAVEERLDRRVIEPRSTTQWVFFVLYQVVFLVLVLWGMWWLPKVDVESASSALGAQAQVSGTVLGLLVAAMVFRWSILSNREQELRKKIHSYFRELAVPSAGVRQNQLNRFVVDLAYDEYLSCINQEKGKVRKKMKEAWRTLGRFWVIRSLSLNYSFAADMTLRPRLRHGEVRDLSRVSKVSRDFAIDMWQSYFAGPARFVLQMHEALQYASRILAINRKYGKEAAIQQALQKREVQLSWSPVEEYGILEKVVGLMRADDTWLIASDIERQRSIRILFYISCGLLFTATILALTILTGVGGFESLPEQQSNILLYLVGVPIGLAVFGVYNSILLLIAILR